MTQVRAIYEPSMIFSKLYPSLIPSLKSYSLLFTRGLKTHNQRAIKTRERSTNWIEGDKRAKIKNSNRANWPNK
jgi:hypothetical protein